MKVAPFRALTQLLIFADKCCQMEVEMKVAPFRALILINECFCSIGFYRRNEGRPIQGIDTFSYYARKSYAGLFVEMSAAPIQDLNTRVITTSTT